MWRTSAKTSSALFLLVGIIAFGVGVFLTARTLIFVVKATHTQGTVVALESHTSATGGSSRRHPRQTSQTWRPVFEFKDGQGSVHRVTEPFGSRPAMFTKGDSVGVLYDAANPASAHIDTVKILWFAPGLLTIMGLVFASVGCFLWKRERRRSSTAGQIA